MIKTKDEVEQIFTSAVIKQLEAHQPPLDRDKMVDSELMTDIEPSTTEQVADIDGLSFKR